MLCFPVVFRRAVIPSRVSRFAAVFNRDGSRAVSKAVDAMADVCQFEEGSREILLPSGVGKVRGTTREACR